MRKNREILRAENIQYSVSGRKQKILDIKSFVVNAGECVFIPGENGAGKSSFLSVLAGYLQPDSGEIFLEGRKLKPLAERLVPGFEEVKYVQQSPDLNPFLTVSEQLEKASRHLSATYGKSRLSKMAELCRLKKLTFQKTGDLSGGEKRRLGIAIALLEGCKLMLLDEPFADLDSENRMIFKVILLELLQKDAFSLIVVSHQGEDAFWLADIIYTLHRGRLVEKLSRNIQGELLPKQFRTARLLGKKNVFLIRDFPELQLFVSENWIQLSSKEISYEPQDSHTKIDLGKWELMATHTLENRLLGIWKKGKLILETDWAVENQSLKKGDFRTLYYSNLML